MHFICILASVVGFQLQSRTSLRPSEKTHIDLYVTSHHPRVEEGRKYILYS